MRTITVFLVTLLACADSTGPNDSTYHFPEITVRARVGKYSATQCHVDFLVTAKRSSDTVSYQLYAPGAPLAPTEAATGRTPLGLARIVDAREFFLDWNVAGPGYHYTAPAPGIVHC